MITFATVPNPCDRLNCVFLVGLTIFEEIDFNISVFVNGLAVVDKLEVKIPDSKVFDLFMSLKMTSFSSLHLLNIQVERSLLILACHPLVVPFLIIIGAFFQIIQDHRVLLQFPIFVGKMI